MKVFDSRWRKGLRAKYKTESKYVLPSIVPLSLEHRFSLERDKIEKWFLGLPEESKPDIMKRLRSEVRQQHFGAYYELVTRQFFENLGYAVDIQPYIKGSNPDLLIRGKNLDKPVVVEVATIFDDPEWLKEEQKLRSIIKKLSEIKHYFFLNFQVESIPIPEKVNYTSVKQFVISWFDSFDPAITKTTQETKCEINGLKLSLLLIPKKEEHKKEKGNIIGGYGLPVRFVGNEQLRKALKKKVNKYAFVKERGYPYIIALSLHSSFSDDEDIVDILFGKTQYVIRKDKTGKIIAEYSQRGTDGLCKHSQNTRLSGVIAIKTKWIADTGNKEKRVHQMTLIHNPYASIHLSGDFLTGYP